MPKRSPARMDQIISGQWSVETKTQWNRDTSQWKDEASRPRNTTSGSQVIALLREAVLRLLNTEAFESLYTGFHHYNAKRSLTALMRCSRENRNHYSISPRRPSLVSCDL